MIGQQIRQFTTGYLKIRARIHARTRIRLEQGLTLLLQTSCFFFFLQLLTWKSISIQNNYILYGT